MTMSHNAINLLFLSLSYAFQRKESFKFGAGLSLVTLQLFPSFQLLSDMVAFLLDLI